MLLRVRHTYIHVWYTRKCMWSIEKESRFVYLAFKSRKRLFCPNILRFHRRIIIPFFYRATFASASGAQMRKRQSVDAYFDIAVSN